MFIFITTPIQTSAFVTRGRLMTYEKIAFQGGRIRRIAKNKRRSKVKGISSHRREMWALARDYVKSEMGKPS